MRIAIVGCGAMGSIYAGLLVSSGNKLIVIDRYESHIKAINQDGLRVSGASGDRVVKVQAFTESPDEQVELVIIAVKGLHAKAAAESALKMLKAESLVLTIQNGLGSAENVADVVGEHRLIVGVAQGFGASLAGPGHSHHNDMKAIKMGAYGSLAQDKVELVSQLWRQAGFDAEAVDEITTMQWEKLICNVAYSGISALTGLTVGEILDHPILGQTSRAAAVEAWTIARALGIKLDVQDPEKLVVEFASRMRLAKPSVLLDIEAGRASEIDLINGAVPREAKKIGMSAPINATLTNLVKALELREEN